MIYLKRIAGCTALWLTPFLVLHYRLEWPADIHEHRPTWGQSWAFVWDVWLDAFWRVNP
jgi:hypothetical protein